ncbi:glycoprotease [Campylobacter portucalensis]|uniref:glycoprotease n=1 Tax=Campylobacter portucalensis TaxID=2608384 RepID=UPI002DD9FD9E|nr:glycoprotease [Campylobacter portucalensis]
MAIYENNQFLKKITSDNKASDFLIEIMDKILKEYDVKELIYLNGPGSFMGIKVAYIILKTISLVKEIPFFAVSGFDLNGNKPIKANKNLSFVKENDKILLKKVEACDFKIPLNLLELNKISDTTPNYVIEAV